jgi:hypothetical protein
MSVLTVWLSTSRTIMDSVHAFVSSIVVVELLGREDCIDFNSRGTLPLYIFAYII